jgi:hypothetical protein
MNQRTGSSFFTLPAGATHVKMAGGTADARKSIVRRMTKLQEIPGFHREEIHAIGSALNQLRLLEAEENQYAEEEKHRAIDDAMEALKAIAPTILRPK